MRIRSASLMFVVMALAVFSALQTPSVRLLAEPARFQGDNPDPPATPVKRMYSSAMFKSCFPNSNLYGSPDDPPAPEPNDEYTVSNAKAVYQRVLTYFATRQDKLFIVITAPPLAESEYGDDAQSPAQRAANARALNNWLVNDWLADYLHANVAVFDYYNVLTSNAGNPDANDLDQEAGNHHRWRNGQVEHVQTVENNFASYPSGDSHPSSAGHRKATAEFVPLLNVCYHRWKGAQAGTPAPTPTPRSEATSTYTPTPGQAEQPTSTPAPTTMPLTSANGVIADWEGEHNWTAYNDDTVVLSTASVRGSSRTWIPRPLTAARRPCARLYPQPRRIQPGRGRLGWV